MVGAAALPAAVRRSTNLILAGAALAVVYGVVDGLTSHSTVFYTYTSTPSGTTVHQANSAASGIIGGVIQCLLWLWMAWKTKEGRSWARVLSSVFFGIYCLGLLLALVAAASHSDAVPTFLVTLVGWGAGPRRSSSSGVPSPVSSSRLPGGEARGRTVRPASAGLVIRSPGPALTSS